MTGIERRSTLKAVQLLARASGNPRADALLDSFLESLTQESGERRGRCFQSVGDGLWEGVITYNNGHDQLSVGVTRVSNGQKVPAGTNWEVRAIDRGGGYFRVEPEGPSTPGTLVLNTRASVLRRSSTLNPPYHAVAGRAANQWAAEVTAGDVFRYQILRFPDGVAGEHYRTVARWVRDDVPIHLVSACCLHADEARTGIVQALDPSLTGLLCRATKIAFQSFPKVSRFTMTTFGPDDYDWLGDLGIMKVLLPYMWNAPRAKVLDDLSLNLRLTESLGRQMAAVLPFPVEVCQISEGYQQVDKEYLVTSSQERAAMMMPRLLEKPPAIFKQMSVEEQYTRVQMEAFLYLLDTIRLGQLFGESREPVLYVGLEVHGGYWEHGDLFRGPRGEFLPLTWMPQCVRQHWGAWVLGNATLGRERQNLGRKLSAYTR